MRKGVAVLALSLLALAGCASAESAAAPSPAPVVEDIETGPCGIRELVPSCSEKLTQIVLAGIAAFDGLEDPTVEQVEADIDLDHGSSAWAANCRQWETYKVGDVVLVDGCQDSLDKIVSAAGVLGVL